uniref:3-beta hydroxysteroid dehydrogenase/isomerase domain-containing protein n=1 Tax=Mola mola TaxID=94237 RepID=A0A3Q4BGB7_MOLML
MIRFRRTLLLLHVLVTGGGGYFGSRLGRKLVSQGMSVILVDVNKPPCDIPDGAVYYQSDIRDYSSLYKVCEGVDCIFHTASYGMSGPEQLRREQVESVNIDGTNNVINACKERSIPRLVYTSTINVVFTGEPIEERDETSVPHVGCAKTYSKCVSFSEMLSCEGGGLLRTCSLRPSGIYGPDERRHLHRVNVERRLFIFRFGDPRARMNWVHVDNLVLAHTLAARALTPHRSYVSSGQVYFINDGVSVNLFEWLTPSITVSHTFKIDKARRELGYCPKPYNLVDCVEQYLKTRQHRTSGLPFNLLHRPLILLLLSGLSLLLLILFSQN